MEIVDDRSRHRRHRLRRRPERGHIEAHDRSCPLSTTTTMTPSTACGQLGWRDGTRSNAGFPEGNLQVCLKRKRAQTRSLEPGRSGDPIRRSGSATTAAEHLRRPVTRTVQPASSPRPTRGCRRALPCPPPWAARGSRPAGTRTGPGQAVIARGRWRGGHADFAGAAAWWWLTDVELGAQPGGVGAELDSHRGWDVGSEAGDADHGGVFTELDEAVVVESPQRVEGLGRTDAKRCRQGVERDAASRRCRRQQVAEASGDGHGGDAEHLAPHQVDVGAEQRPAVARSSWESDEFDPSRRLTTLKTWSPCLVKGRPPPQSATSRPLTRKPITRLRASRQPHSPQPTPDHPHLPGVIGSPRHARRMPQPLGGHRTERATPEASRDTITRTYQE